MAWRSFTIRVDLQGNILWLHGANFRSACEAGDTECIASVGQSANEFVISNKNGRIVSVTDEGFGFGFIAYDDTVRAEPTC